MSVEALKHFFDTVGQGCSRREWAGKGSLKEVKDEGDVKKKSFKYYINYITFVLKF